MATGSSRIPAFNAADPELWFKIVEANFSRLQITDPQLKYFEVIAVIPPHCVKEVRDIIMAPTTTESYATLKAELVKRLSASQEEKTRQLLENEAMGDEKPSQFLRRLQSLAGSAVPESLVRSLWMRRLPSSLQPIIATQMDKELAVAAELADAIQASTSNEMTIATAQPNNESQLAQVLQQLSSKLDSLVVEMNKVKCEVAEVRSTHSRSRPRSRSRSQSRNRSQASRPQGMCWYHWKFGSAATKCTQPCSMSENNRGGR